LLPGNFQSLMRLQQQLTKCCDGRWQIVDIHACQRRQVPSTVHSGKITEFSSIADNVGDVSSIADQSPQQTQHLPNQDFVTRHTYDYTTRQLNLDSTAGLAGNSNRNKTRWRFLTRSRSANSLLSRIRSLTVTPASCDTT
jgi:hypothetical protein